MIARPAPVPKVAACSRPFSSRSSSAGSPRSCCSSLAAGLLGHLDRPARPRLLLARGRHRRLPGPRAGRRARLRGAAGRVRHARSSSRSACGRSRGGARARYDSLTAIVLVGCLAVGRDPRRATSSTPAASVETLLFGSLLLIDPATSSLAARRAAALVLRRPSRSGRAGWRPGFDPDGRARPRPALRAARRGAARPGRASRRSRRLAAVGALLASALIVVPAATVRLWTRAAAALAGRRGRPGGARGHRRPLALGQDQRAAGRDDRRALRRGLRARRRRRGRSRRAARRAAAPAAGAAIAGAARARAACGARAARLRRQSPRRRDHHPARRLRARGRRRPRRRSTRSCSPTPTRTSTSRARATSRATAGAERGLHERRQPRRVDGRGRLGGGRRRRASSTSARPFP